MGIPDSTAHRCATPVRFIGEKQCYRWNAAVELRGDGSFVSFTSRFLDVAER